MRQTSPEQANNAHALRAEPEAKRGPGQLNPDFFYTITIGDRLLAQIVANGDTDVRVEGSTVGTLPRNTESWYVSVEALAGLADADSVTITAEALHDSVKIHPTCNEKFSSPVRADWIQNLPLPTDGTTHVFSGSPAFPERVTAYVVLNVPTSGAPSLAQMQWHLSDPPPDTSFKPAAPSAPARYSRSKLPPRGCFGAASR